MHFLEQTEAIYFVLTTKNGMANKKITAMFHKLLPLNTLMSIKASHKEITSLKSNYFFK